jgi:hypothetical protein
MGLRQRQAPHTRASWPRLRFLTSSHTAGCPPGCAPLPSAVPTLCRSNTWARRGTGRHCAAQEFSKVCSYKLTCTPRRTPTAACAVFWRQHLCYTACHAADLELNRAHLTFKDVAREIGVCMTELILSHSARRCSISVSQSALGRRALGGLSGLRRAANLSEPTERASVEQTTHNPPDTTEIVARRRPDGWMTPCRRSPACGALCVDEKPAVPSSVRQGLPIAPTSLARTTCAVALLRVEKQYDGQLALE